MPRLLGWDRERQAAHAPTNCLISCNCRRSNIATGCRANCPAASASASALRAIAAEPRVVLMDEPFGALDLRTRDALTRDYRKLHDQLKLTTVMITHDVIEAVLLADRIAVMQDGRLLGLGTPKALMSDPQNQKCAR